MANTSPPWAQYRVIEALRLITLDKYSGVCPIGVGETMLHFLAKYVLAVSGKEEKLACSADQVCMGTEGDIEVAIHASKALVDQHRLEED